DYRILARWNSIDPPYTIYAGQKLRLTSSSEKPTKDRTNLPISEQKQIAVHTVDHESEEKGKTKLSVSSPLTETQSTSLKKTPQSTKLTKVVQGIYWHWPTRGQIIHNFSRGAPDQKGIDIAGQLGQAVV